jgi:hypothetical protein
MPYFYQQCQTPGCKGKIRINTVKQSVPAEHPHRLMFTAVKEYKRCKKCNSNYSIHGPGIRLTKLS